MKIYTAEQIEAALKAANIGVVTSLIKDKTVMVIAHRMRTVAGANKVVVLSDGGVAEQGSPAELMEQDGVFAQMVRLQTEGQNWSIA